MMITSTKCEINLISDLHRNPKCWQWIEWLKLAQRLWANWNLKLYRLSCDRLKHLLWMIHGSNDLHLRGKFTYKTNTVVTAPDSVSPDHVAWRIEITAWSYMSYMSGIYQPSEQNSSETCWIKSPPNVCKHTALYLFQIHFRSHEIQPFNSSHYYFVKRPRVGWGDRLPKPSRSRLQQDSDSDSGNFIQFRWTQAPYQVYIW